MATVNITRYSSYEWDEVSGGHTPEGSITITLGSMTVILSQDEWRRIRGEVENNTGQEAFR